MPTTASRCLVALGGKEGAGPPPKLLEPQLLGRERLPSPRLLAPDPAQRAFANAAVARRRGPAGTRRTSLPQAVAGPRRTAKQGRPVRPARCLACRSDPVAAPRHRRAPPTSATACICWTGRRRSRRWKSLDASRVTAGVLLSRIRRRRRRRRARSEFDERPRELLRRPATNRTRSATAHRRSGERAAPPRRRIRRSGRPERSREGRRSRD